MKRDGAWLLLLVFLVLRPPRKIVGKAAIVQLAASLGFPDPNLAAAVALAESGGDANAIGDFGRSFGLWQIHLPKHPQYDRSKLLDPTYNGRAAFEISKGGTNWGPWTCFNNGAYRKYL